MISGSRPAARRLTRIVGKSTACRCDGQEGKRARLTGTAAAISSVVATGRLDEGLR